MLSPSSNNNDDDNNDNAVDTMTKNKKKKKKNNNNNKEATRQSMRSEQVSLPLLSSLPFETTTPLLHCVFTQCAAQRTIRNFLRSHTAAPLVKKQGQSTPLVTAPSLTNNANALPTTKRKRRTVPAAREHFIFQALSSNSLPIRQHASLQLVHAADNPNRISILTRVLWDMVQDEMDDFCKVASALDRGSLVMVTPSEEEADGAGGQSVRDSASVASSSSSSSSPSSSSCNGGEFLEAERIVQMYGLLVHYVTEHNHERFYNFLIQGGLHWVCQRVLALVSLLIVPSRRVGQEAGGESISPSLDAAKVNDILSPSPTFSPSSSSSAQTRYMSFSSSFQEEITKRLYILVDFCSRLTVLAHEKYKGRNEIAYEWFWKRRSRSQSQLMMNQFHSNGQNQDEEVKAGAFHQNYSNNVSDGKLGGIELISPLACIIGAAQILKRSKCVSSNSPGSSSVSTVLTAEDYVAQPGKELNAATWILEKIIDIQGDIIILPKESESSEGFPNRNTTLPTESAGGDVKKRKASLQRTGEKSTVRGGNESSTGDVFGDEGPSNPLLKRRRLLSSSAANDNRVESSGDASSSFGRNEMQGKDRSRLLPSSLESLIQLTMASNSLNGERNNGNFGYLDENDEHNKSGDDDQCSNPFDEDEDDEMGSDVDMDDSEENEGMIDDEEVESEIEDEHGRDDVEEEEDIDHDEDDDDGNDEDDDYDEDRDEEHILDDIILNARSNPFQCNNLMVVDADLENISSTLSATNQRLKDALRQKQNSSGIENSTSIKDKSKAQRSEAFLRASIELLCVQHPQQIHSHHSHTNLMMPTRDKEIGIYRRTRQSPGYFCTVLTPSAEQELLQKICNIVRPPKEPLKLKVYLRRAPTQEEFFRGSLSQNPIPIASLKGDVNTTSSDYDPTVKDLRQHIANDLQMADSAELLELLVANKILDMNLKLRVVAQTLWRSHMLENNSVTQAESTLRQIMAASIFGESAILSRSRFDEDSPMSDLPPMVVTYRLAGVDGEATEDKIEENELEDPDASSTKSTTDAEYEAKMEKEYGVTRLISKGRGINILLRSLEMHLEFVMKRIRRDDIDSQAVIFGKQIVRKNKARLRFLKDAPCPALTLLQYCAVIGDNRKKMINAQAPTVLLRLLLDVLNSIDQTSKSKESGNNTSPNRIPTSQYSTIISSNPTTEALQALIENLSSDISNEMMKRILVKSSSQDYTDSDDSSDNEDEETTTLPILLSSLQTTSLSPPLRKVVAKLLPFLTYGQRSQSRALASQFLKHVQVEKIETFSAVSTDNKRENCAVLMETFIDAAVHLPPAAICDTLRTELISQGFVSNIKNFVLKSVPSRPPPWSTALYSKKEKLCENERKMLYRQWETYYSRNGLTVGFKILNGLCTDHKQTQSYLGNSNDTGDKIPLVVAAHWIESTSDKEGINTNGLGILAETLLDNMMNNNDNVRSKISELRGKTRDRKKELAQEQRQKALAKMGGLRKFKNSPPDALQSGIAKFPVIDYPTKITALKSSTFDDPSTNKPAWMLEMEAMEDESGLVCSVCQEGRNYKPSEILGLYAFMKKVNIPQNRGGGCSNIDGTLLLLSLPPRLPVTLRGSEADDEWYQPSMTLASQIKSTSHGVSTLAASTTIMGPRSYNFVTTVTAGNAIHCRCHAKARSADRNHPKAPKSEWEGASLRNSRVSCNAILPLLSKHNQKIPVMEMESALADHQQAVSNILGAKPKSMLWTILHDVRLLILRIAYGEALNIDCGGGSLSSNVSLIFHNLFLAHMFAKNTEHDSSANVLQAKGLSTAYLAASSILKCTDLVQTTKTKQLRRAFADCAPMSALCCILFQNTINEEDVSSANAIILSTENVPNIPPPKRRWELNKYHFLSGLLQCAGRRHALGIDGSGCATGRRVRSSSLSEWNEDNSNLSPRRHIGKRNGLSVEEYGRIMRPMLILYACLDQLSSVFTPQMDDEVVENCAQQLVKTIESCQKAGDIRSLIHQANISLDDTAIIEEIQAGINTV